MRRSNAAGTGNEAERGMGDDDGIPVRGRGARQEAGTLLLREVGLVGDQDAGGRVELEELAGSLRQAVAGDDQHRLGNQAEPLLFHDGGRDGEGLARADGVRDVVLPPAVIRQITRFWCS